MNRTEPYVCPVCGKASSHPLDAKYGHCAACGANRIQTGVYEVGGTLHVIIPDLLRANGWPATPENVDLVTRTERLMGWPDDHTRYTADGQEIKDGQRYKMCGNGVVAPVAEWIARRIMAAVNG